MVFANVKFPAYSIKHACAANVFAGEPLGPENAISSLRGRTRANKLSLP